MKTIQVVLTLWVGLSFAIIQPTTATAQSVTVYASPAGDATGTGSSASSPVSLARARVLVRSNPTKSCTIYLLNGVYGHFALDSTDSRSASAPVTYQAVNPHGAVVEPQTALDSRLFSAIPDSIARRIIDPVARGKVKQLPLSSLQLVDTAQWPLLFSVSAMQTPRFFKDGIPLPMSRYPVDTTMTMGQVITKGSYRSNPGGSFKYTDDRMQQWTQAVKDGGLYLCGNWQFTWRIDVVKTLSIDTKNKVVAQAIGLENGIGTQDPGRLKSGTEPFYAINLVEEINAEGQWSVNFRTGMLYMWVPASGKVTVDGNAGQAAIALRKVNNCSFVGIDVRGGSGDGFSLTQCNNVLIAGSSITYISGYGARVTDGSNNTIQSNDITLVGAGGVIVSSSALSADQSVVRSSGHRVINNHIYNYATMSPVYSAAVDVSTAIGAYVGYNKVHNAPHVGIMHGGNNNVLEYNEVYDVVKKYTDMGAIYKFENYDNGWNARGSKVYNNYIHDAPKANGIYEDDCASGDSCNYNIIANVVMAAYNHNGYFNSYDNNIYSGNLYPLTVMTEASTAPEYSKKYATLRSLWNGSAAYRKAYPECADMVGASGRNNSPSSRIWPRVTGSVFISNTGVLSYISIAKLFNRDGTTNKAYAENDLTATPQTCYFAGNRLMALTYTSAGSFRIDSLRKAGIFKMTGDSNWHINRIGLHKDAYRKDVTSWKTDGIDPLLTLQASSRVSGLKTSDTVRLTGVVKIPNAANVLSSVKLMDGTDEVKGAIISKKKLSYDSVRYTIEWRNPSAGAHRVTMHGYDGDIWEYVSPAVNFSVVQDSTEKPKADTVVTPAPPADTVAVPAADTVAVPAAEPPVVVPPVIVPPVTEPPVVVPPAPPVTETPAPPVTTPVPPADSVVVPVPPADSVVTTPGDSVVTPAPPADSVAVPAPPADSVTIPPADTTVVPDPSVPSKQGSSHLAEIDQANRKMVLYPNPANSVLNASYWNTQASGNIRATIYDNSGRMIVGTAAYMQTGVGQMSFNVSGMAAGIYVLLVENPDHTIVSQRFIVQH